jgi:hypothetical protein
VETMDKAGYTYLLLDTGAGRIWVAGPTTRVKVGERVGVSAGTLMTDFRSRALDRTFDRIYLVTAIQPVRNGGTGAGMPGRPAMPGPPGAIEERPHESGARAIPEARELDFTGLTRPDRGHTVAELHAARHELADQMVVVRGKVVRVNAGILGANWIHVQDGTGEQGDGTHDLTVTTQATVAVGDTVLVKGKLSVDRRLAMGRHYPVILENAAVTVEKP